MYEIERQFLIEDYPVAQVSNLPALSIRQTYLDNTGDWSIRGRSTTPQNPTAGSATETTLTLKRTVGHGMRVELEDNIQHHVYDEMVILAGAELLKTRIKIPYGDYTIDFDVFHNPELNGLMKAEIELTSISDTILIPSWFGREVTGDEEYSNHQLFKRLARS